MKDFVENVPQMAYGLPSTKYIDHYLWTILYLFKKVGYLDE